MSACHILKSVCLVCEKLFSTKLKLCKRGANGRVCLRTDPNRQVNAQVNVGGDGRTYLDLTEIMEVVIIRNRNPLCSCRKLMDALNARQLKKSEDVFLSEDKDRFMTGRSYVKMEV